MLSLWGIAAGPAKAQTDLPDSLQWALVATFVQARALAVDLQGHLYVADAGRHVIVRFSPDRQAEAILGGPGSGPGQFDTPVALHVGGGLMLWVAEAGNHRLQQLTWQGAPLEVVPLPEGITPEGIYAQGRHLWVLDAKGAALWKRLSDGRWQKIAQMAHQPVALTPGRRGQLLVAEAGQNRVLAYDALGILERPWIEGLPATPRALTSRGDTLWMVLDRRLYRYTPGAGLEEWQTTMPDVIGIAVHRGIVYVLTPTHLYRSHQFNTPGRR